MCFSDTHEILPCFTKKYTYSLRLLCYDTGTEVS